MWPTKNETGWKVGVVPGSQLVSISGEYVKRVLHSWKKKRIQFKFNWAEYHSTGLNIRIAPATVVATARLPRSAEEGEDVPAIPKGSPARLSETRISWDFSLRCYVANVLQDSFFRLQAAQCRSDVDRVSKRVSFSCEDWTATSETHREKTKKTTKKTTKSNKQWTSGTSWYVINVI